MAERACGTCTLCCKLFAVPDLDKPAGRWCPHLVQARGCGIHPTRPGACRAFFCQWIYNDALGPAWKPEVARFVLSIYPGSQSLAVTLDPAQKAAWRRPPYEAELRRWATAALAQGSQVMLFLADRATLLLPEGEAELGVLAPGDAVAVRLTPSGYAVDVRRAAPA